MNGVSSANEYAPELWFLGFELVLLALVLTWPSSGLAIAAAGHGIALLLVGGLRPLTLLAWHGIDAALLAARGEP